jgi:carbamoyltransferase
LVEVPATPGKLVPIGPLAPAVLQDRVSDYFEVSSDFESKYMLLTVKAKAVTRQLCPAAVHVDGSARAQTVNRHAEEPLSIILQALESKGLPPMVLNTSLNGKGQPIAETPEEAFALFKELPIDMLVTANLVISKMPATNLEAT